MYNVLLTNQTYHSAAEIGDKVTKTLTVANGISTNTKRNHANIK